MDGMNTRLFAVLRSIVFAVLFMSIWLWFVPRWIAAGKGVPFRFEPGVASLILIILGGLVGVRCVFDFAWTGRGTPAPFDPPRQLVIAGFYRWVRNPMYVGLIVMLIGEALALPAIRNETFVLAGAVWVASTLFVVLHEEPKLRTLFGEDYVEYCRNVRRWIPRLTPFDKPRAAAVVSPDLE